MGLGFGVWGLGFRVLGLGFLGFSVYRPPEVDRIWGIRGSYYNIPRAIFYLLKGGYREWATLGSYKDNGKEHGNYYNILGRI